MASDFTSERLADPSIQAIIPRVEVEERAEQERWAAFVDVVLEDGETLHAEQDTVLGHPDNPMTWDDMEHKFMGLVGPVLGQDAEPLLQALQEIDKPGQLPRVLACIRR